VQTNALRGPIDIRQLPGVLLTLESSSESGRLSLSRHGVTRDIYVQDGAVVAADSSVPTDSLEWLLFTAGVLSEEALESVRSKIRDGVKRGAALIDSAGLPPGTVMDWVERRVRFLARDVLSWDQGEYGFEPGESLPEGGVRVAIRPSDILLEAYRESVPEPALSALLDAEDTVLRPFGMHRDSGRRLLPHERYVLSLNDGQRTFEQVLRLSELGVATTRKISGMLVLAGFLCEGAAAMAPASGAARRPHSSETDYRTPGAIGLAVPAEDSPSIVRAIIRHYNELYGYLFAYMLKEVGPITEQLFEKSLRELRGHHPALFARVLAGKDGTLPEEMIVRNVNLVRDRHRPEALMLGLHEYLVTLVLTVRRILGPEHEIQVIRRLRAQRCAEI